MFQSQLSNLDYIILGGYFCLVFGIALAIILKEKGFKKSNSKSAYFLGGKNLGWFVVGASLFASNIGSEHLVGLAGAGASGDFPVAQFEIIAAFMLLILGWLFVPFYIKSGVFTMPEFLEKRYSPWARSYLSWVSILGYVLTKISVTIAAGGIIFSAILGIDFWTGAIIVVLSTGLYTIFGGLKAVIYTDVMQLFILLGGSLAVCYYGLEALGGWDQLVVKTEPAYLSLWRDGADMDFPWTGILFGAPILGVWYWCTDQFIVQRVLAAKNIDTARKGTIFAAYLKLLPLFIFVIPGVIAYALSVGANPKISFPIEDGQVVYDAALPLLTMQFLPSGMKGLVVAGLLAALMSSLSSVFNSCSTLISIDIYKKYFPSTSDKKLVRVGQFSTALLVVLGLAWIPVLKLIEGGLFQKIQSIQSYISPPIAAVFLLGLFHKRINEVGAKYSLLIGALLGSIRLILEIYKSSLSGFWLWYADMNFLHFALFLFLICSVVLILFSILSERRIGIQDRGLSLNFLKKNKYSLNLNQGLSLALVCIIIFLWYEFY